MWPDVRATTRSSSEVLVKRSAVFIFIFFFKGKYLLLLSSGFGGRLVVTCVWWSVTVLASCGASGMTTRPGFTLGAMEEDSSRDWPAAQITFTHRQMWRASTSMRTRDGTLSLATPIGELVSFQLGKLEHWCIWYCVLLNELFHVEIMWSANICSL